MNDSSDEESHYGVPQLYKYIQTETSKLYFNSSTSIARSQQNIRLNRYNNVAPYDEHRVVLENHKGNDYINASIAKSSADPPEQFYILAQGPLQRTVFDFWRMGWERNVKSIVMLNKLIEQNRPKCDRYWPHDSFEPLICNNQNDPEQCELYFVVSLKVHLIAMSHRK
jgi:protein tyrosine phosphatase